MVVIYVKDPEMVAEKRGTRIFWAKIVYNPICNLINSLLDIGWIYPIGIHLNLGNKSNK